MKKKKKLFNEKATLTIDWTLLSQDVGLSMGKTVRPRSTTIPRKLQTD